MKGASAETWEAAKKDLKETNFDENLDAEELCNKLIDTLEKIVVKNFKQFAPPSREGNKSKNFIPRDARCLLRKKLNASRTLKKTTDPDTIVNLKDKISVIEEDLRKLIHRKRAYDENKARKDLKREPEEFFNLVRKMTKKSDKVRPLKRNKTNKNWPACKILSDQYSSVFSQPRPEDMFDNPTTFFNEEPEHLEYLAPSLSEFEVNHVRISKAIDKLPVKSAPGPDGVSNLIIKQLKFELIPILQVLFSKSLDTSQIPSHFLKAYVKPIRKPKKPRSEPSSYRPVSLTSGLSKAFEHVLKEQVQEYLESNDILNDNQHGFRPMRSCLTQLLGHYNTIINDLEEGKVTDVVYLDFAKAFDSVDINILSKELRRIGIRGKAGLWIHGFLTNRQQQIIAENKLSSPAKVLSGVPQGTVLGPLCFLIMINTLSDNDLETRISMFTDDTRIARGIRDNDDIQRLQDDLDRVFLWQRKNNMDFNSDKFQYLSHGGCFRSNRRIPKGQYLDNIMMPIKTESTVRDLGIEISAFSDFLDHINLTCKRARDKGAWIYRSFYSRDVVFLSFMWKTYIQPILEYGSQLWAPSKAIEIKKLKDVFKNYSARAQQFNKPTEKLHFWERLKLFNVRSQQRRQDRFRIICVWKIINELSPNCSLSWSESEANGRLCTIPSSPYDSSRRVKTLRESSFQVRGPALYNALPHEIRSMKNCSLNSFKNALDDLLDKIPDTPLSQTYYPVPTDRISAAPSNSVIDWLRYLEVPTRRGGDLKSILKTMIKSSRYQESQVILDPLAASWTNLTPKGLVTSDRMDNI